MSVVTMHSECFRTLEMNIASSPISMPSGKKILLFFMRFALNSLEWGSDILNIHSLWN